MKLTFIHDGPLFYDSEGRYYEFAYHELLERYAYLADDITFMMRTKPISGDRKFTPVPSAVHVVSVPNFKSPKLYLTERKRAEKIVEKQVRNSDIVVLRTQSSIAQLALKYIHELKKPYIIESVGCSWDSYWNHGMLGKMVAPYMYYKTKKAIAEAGYVYYVTTQFLQKRYPTNGKSVSCSNVVLDKLEGKTLDKRLEKIHQFNPNEKLVLGTAAALDTRYKGQEYVIRSIRGLLETGYNVEYHLAGGMTGAKENSFLKELAYKCGVSERVIFCGSLASDQMPEYYDSLDIYVQPSKQEGLPRAVIEAMSRGCPVIGTSIAGIPELVQEQFLFKKGSEKDFVKALQRILKSDLSEIATENFEKARKYEKNNLKEKRERFYDQFLSDIDKLK